MDSPIGARHGGSRPAIGSRSSDASIRADAVAEAFASAAGNGALARVMQRGVRPRFAPAAGPPVLARAKLDAADLQARVREAIKEFKDDHVTLVKAAEAGRPAPVEITRLDEGLGGPSAPKIDEANRISIERRVFLSLVDRLPLAQRGDVYTINKQQLVQRLKSAGIIDEDDNKKVTDVVRAFIKIAAGREAGGNDPAAAAAALDAEVALEKTTIPATVVQHIMDGHVNGATVTGYHSRQRATGTHRAYGPRTDLAKGVSTQSVAARVGGVWKRKKYKSTFYPDDMTQDQILDAVASVLVDRKKGKREPVVSKPGSPLEGERLTLLNTDGKLASAFPVGGADEPGVDPVPQDL